ncbi:hypothetical protein ONS96_010699 [Cadophora gregata f. sp. sojae]|nr:hypothetical protein ONS96_010699 [Cadophora gregata f. sp. sojae]
MNMVEQSVAGNNGGPARREYAVIDLTSEDDDDGFFEDAQELADEQNGHRIKRERLEVRDDLRREPVERMGDRPAFGQAAQPHNAPAIPDVPYARVRDVWGDYDLDEDFDDEFIAGAFDFDEEYPPIGGPVIQPAAPAPPPPARPAMEVPIPEAVIEARIDCVDTVVNVFPGICRDYVSELYDTISKSSERLIEHILDKMDKGHSYPNAKEKEKEKQKILKRKRSYDEDAEAARKYGAPDRIMPTNIGGIRSYIARILSYEFPLTAMNFINATLSRSGYRLFSAYEVLEEAERTWSDNKLYPRLKHARKSSDFTEKKVSDYLAFPGVIVDREKVEVFEELQAARRIRQKADARRAAERAAEVEEEENIARAEAEGTMSECQCCCCDYPLNRMVHCNGETLHWFCRGCAKRTAEVEIGKSKYELHCMSTDKCPGGFSLDQRAQFLDENTRVALERNEQEANLRLAGIENLESCPFCPFAAEYPPVEVDREFRCQAPDCEKVSCRLCRLESHIPKSCEENAKDNGLSIRRQIEEAMSAAMIRKCNKCGTPFVKEEGCNKMTCTRNGCFNIQCYVCSKSCDYNHFNDPTRGGKAGNCPLFESVEQRHDNEVKKAEKEALQKVLSDHPEYSEEDLKIKMSENVKEDDEKRKSMDPRARLEARRAAGARPGPRAVNFMQLRPMMPRPAAMIRRVHDLPEFPQLLNHPNQLDPIYDDMDFNYFDDEVEVAWRWRRPRRPARDPVRYLPPPALPRVDPPQAAMQAHVAQPMPAPVADGPADIGNNDALDDFYQPRRADDLHRQAPHPRTPDSDSPEDEDAEPVNDNERHLGRPNAANIIVLSRRQAPVPVPVPNQPGVRPNAPHPPVPPKAVHADPLQRVRLQLRRSDGQENAERVREQKEADALAKGSNEIRGTPAREARQAEQIVNAENARFELELLRMQHRQHLARAQSAIQLDPMEGVVQDGPALVADAQRARLDPLLPAAVRHEELYNRLRALEATQPQARLPARKDPAENIDRRNRLPGDPHKFRPVPPHRDGPVGLPRPVPAPGRRLEELFQELNEDAELLQRLERLHQQKHDNALANIEPPAPLGPNEARPDVSRRPNPRAASENNQDPAIMNAAALAKPNNIPNANANQNQNNNSPNRPRFYDNNPEPRQRRQVHLPEVNAIPNNAYRMPLYADNFNDLPRYQVPPARAAAELDVRALQEAQELARRRQVIARAEAEVQNRERALIQVRMAKAQIAQAQAQVAAAQVQAEAAQIRAQPQAASVVAPGVAHPPPPQRYHHVANAQLRQYAMLYHPGADLNGQHAAPGANIAGGAVGAAVPMPAHRAAPVLLREANDAALEYMRQQELRMELAAIQEQFYQPEDVVEEYESDDEMGAGEAGKKV